MTLTPLKIGDEAARCRTQRLHTKKLPDESNAVGEMIATLTRQRTGSRRNPDGASAWWTLAGPFLSWCVARGKPHARHAPASLQLEVSRFVIVARPARPERTPMPFSQSVRTGRRAVRRHQPDRKTKSRRTCAGGSSVHRRVSRRGLVVAEKNCF